MDKLGLHFRIPIFKEGVCVCVCNSVCMNERWLSTSQKSEGTVDGSHRGKREGGGGV